MLVVGAEARSKKVGRADYIDTRRSEAHSIGSAMSHTRTCGVLLATLPAKMSYRRQSDNGTDTGCRVIGRTSRLLYCVLIAIIEKDLTLTKRADPARSLACLQCASRQFSLPTRTDDRFTGFVTTSTAL
jgi:hypothetical protein